MKKNLPLFFLFLITLPLFAQSPPNDNCVDAIEIGDVTDEPFSNINATTDGHFHLNPPCPGASSVDSLYNDIWYRYTPQYNGYALWTICGTANFDTKIAVYQPGASCPPRDEDLMNCNEDAGECAGSTSEIIFPVDSAQTYLLRLAGFGQDTPGEEGTGTFSVNRITTSLVNDFCPDALEITVGLGQAFTTIGATTDGPNHPDNPCFGFGDISAQSDAWYAFIADSTGTIEWSTCDAIVFDSRLAVYGPDLNCPFKDEDLYACNDDGPGCNDYTSRLVFEVEKGSKYYLRIGGYDGRTGNGTFDLKYIEPQEPPANDLCANAQEIFIISPDAANNQDTFFTGTTINAGFDQNNFSFPGCLENAGGGEFAEVWYRFNSLGNEEIELRLDILTTGASFFVDVWEADCSVPVDTLSLVMGCTSSPDGADNWRDTFALFPAVSTDYILRVLTRLTSDLPGDFFLQLVGGVSTSTVSLSPFSEWLIYPNPATEKLYVDLNLPESLAGSFEVMNTLGQIVRLYDKKVLPGGRSIEELDLHSLDHGLYLLRVNTPLGTKSFKFLKQQ